MISQNGIGEGFILKSKSNALAIAGAAAEKKASDIVIIDMRKFPSVCDYFIIASGTSTTQVRAISDNIARKLRDKGERIWHIEGEREALWVLLDFGDVVAHVFCEETRRYYHLEKLWSEAPQEKFVEGREPTRKKRRPSPRIKKKKRKKSKYPPSPTGVKRSRASADNPPKHSGY